MYMKIYERNLSHFKDNEYMYNIKLKVEDHPMMVQGHKMHALHLQAHNLMHLHLNLKVSSS